jgi:hypothetical protein
MIDFITKVLKVLKGDFFLVHAGDSFRPSALTLQLRITDVRLTIRLRIDFMIFCARVQHSCSISLNCILLSNIRLVWPEVCAVSVSVSSARFWLVNRLASDHASGWLFLRDHIVVSVVIVTVFSRGFRCSAGTQKCWKACLSCQVADTEQMLLWRIAELETDKTDVDSTGVHETLKWRRC